MSSLSRLYALCAFVILAGSLAVYMVGNQTYLSWVQWGAVFAGTFGMSRIISRETVCEPIRNACGKIGLEELITCPRCVGAWIDLGLVALMLASPAYAMLVCGLFGVAGANIIVHEVMGILVRKSRNLDILNNNMMPPLVTMKSEDMKIRFDEFNNRFFLKKGDSEDE